MSEVCVFEWRYGSNEMRRIFSRENILRKYIEVEMTLARALSELSVIPSECYRELLECSRNVNPEKINAYEKLYGHEINAMISAIERECGNCGRFIHYGASSGDIIDSAWILILRESLEVIKSKLRRILERLADLSNYYRDLIVIGRTHGQHAEPITLGFKFANYLYEISRSYERICDSEKRVLKCKISGAVGVMGAWEDKGLEIEKLFSKYIGLPTHEISTQIYSRDGFAEIAFIMAILASQIDRFALEIRELSRSEINEVYELSKGYDSSSMPHKRNPMRSERISGLARVARSLSTAFLENIVIMHERDLTNMSSERILIPHLFLTIDQMLEDFTRLLEEIKIDKRSIERNLNLSRGVIFSERIALKLVERGVSREEAFRKLHEISMKTISSERDFKDILLEDDLIRRYFSIEEIEKLLKPESYLGSYKEIIGRAVEYYLNAVNRC
ncbi:MAG: adenylosuccinate lyase [Sulfolobales archaeon]